MSDKPLTDKEKQFTVLPNEADPKSSYTKAKQAISKALAEIKKGKGTR
jgi:hypothetical protein